MQESFFESVYKVGGPPLREFDFDVNLPFYDSIEITSNKEQRIGSSDNSSPENAKPTTIQAEIEDSGIKEEVEVVEQSENLETTLDTENVDQNLHKQEFDLQSIISNSWGKHEKIETFNGNYSLKEKIMFINVLFHGSSESFGTAVKQIDTFNSIEETLPLLNFLSSSNGWQDVEKATLERFIQKIVAKYA